MRKFDRKKDMCYNNFVAFKGGNKFQMKIDDKASISLKKIICISIILIFLLSAGVMAGNVQVRNVKIVLSSGYEMDILTTKTSVKDILDENHIVLLEDEKVTPDTSEEISDNNTIVISKESEEVVDDENAEVIESSSEVTADEILDSYSEIVEKIVVKKEKIPFETITRDVSSGNGKKQDTVIQKGQNGIRQVTYKVKYQNGEEIERTKISSKVIKKPVDKIVEVRTKQITTRSSGTIRATGTKAQYQAYAKSRCQAYGWSDYDFDCLVSLWNKESGWNPYAHNSSSGAHGIAQALPASKMSSHGSDYMTNYKTQINWGLSYIKSRYGTPANAWSHSCSTGWY